MPRAEARLGDFGAASFFPRGVQSHERFNARAYGYAIDDALSHVKGNIPVALLQLKDSCLNMSVEKRPSFAEIAEVLEKLKS